MALEHIRWEKAGRTYRKTETGEFVFHTSTGSRNVWDGIEYQPYIWDESQETLKFGGDTEIKFFPVHQVFKRAGNELVSQSRFFVEIQQPDDSWARIPPGQIVRSVTPDPSGNGRCVGRLNHLHDDFDLDVDYKVGAKRGCIFGFRYRPKIAETVRFVLELNGIEPLGNAPGYEWINAKFTDEKVGVRFKDLIWRWKKTEAAQRDVAVSTQGNKKTLTITFGPFDIDADEWLEVSPDTWGANGAGWSADVINVENTVYQVFELDGDDTVGYVQESGDDVWVRTGTRWDAVNIGASAVVSKVEARFYIKDEIGDPADFQVYEYGTNQGSDDPEVDADADAEDYWNECGAGVLYTSDPGNGDAAWTDWLDLGAAAITDIEWGQDNSKTTYAVGCKTADLTGATRLYQVEEYDQANDSELRITYTIGGVGGDATISGGGSLVVSGEKEGIGDVGLAGGGSLVVTGLKATGEDAAISGGGSLVVTGEKARPATISGGGVLIASGEKGGLVNAVISGGGSLIVDGTSGDVEGTASISGGGSLIVTGVAAGDDLRAITRRAIERRLYDINKGELK